MRGLRAFIDHLRDRYGVAYPLAHERPFVADRRLLQEAQDIANLDAEFCLVATVSGQLILTPPSQSFVERVTWADDLAVDGDPIRIRTLRSAWNRPSALVGRPYEASAQRRCGSMSRQAKTWRM